jgi:DNA-directed RNA polymerase subunit H (RpoH/RPB5)
MHALQPKHTKLKSDEVRKLLASCNISLVQLPKIRIDDPALGGNFNVGDVVKIERKIEDKIRQYFRVVVL